MAEFKQMLANLPQSILDTSRFVPVYKPKPCKLVYPSQWMLPRLHRKFDGWATKLFIKI